MLLLSVVALSGAGGCKWKKKKAQGADASAGPVLTAVPMVAKTVPAAPPTTR